jgi:hypothetical protein
MDMKNLRYYIIPQIFNNIMFKYHKNQLFEYVNMREIKNDLPKEFNHNRWKLTIEKNNDFKGLFWDKSGEFLGVIGDR